MSKKSIHLNLLFVILLGLAIILAQKALAANGPDFLWAKQGVSADSAVAYRVAVDAAENVFVAGSFRVRLGLGDTNLVSGRWHTNDFGLPPYVEYSEDIYVAKYNSDGLVMWARSAGGVGSDYALGMAVDSGGNCYVTGSFQGVADFGGVYLTNSTAPPLHQWLLFDEV